MSPDRILVTVTALLLIAFIFWFFWMKKTKGSVAKTTAYGYQEALIIVKGGYTPDTILVRKNLPVRLNFLREETAACSEMVVFPDFNKSAQLPTGETISVELIPTESGEYEFTCQMGMLRGKLIVEN